VEVLLISAESSEVTADLQAALREAGHQVGRDLGMHTPDVAVVLISSASGKDAISDASREAESIQSLGRPMIGVTLTPARELPVAAATVPHDGPWTEVLGRDPDAYQVVLESIRQRSELSGPLSLQRDAAAAEVESGVDDQQTVAPALFISYSSRDKGLVDDVCDSLTERGYRDTSGLEAGTVWREGIAKAIRNSDIFVLFLSPNVVRYPARVTEELQLAQEYEKRIIPVYLLETPVLPHGSELILSPLQRISLFPDFNGGLNALTAAIGSLPAASATRGRIEGEEVRRGGCSGRSVGGGCRGQGRRRP
jgi:hypothetical protein